MRARSSAPVSHPFAAGRSTTHEIAASMRSSLASSNCERFTASGSHPTQGGNSCAETFIRIRNNLGTSPGLLLGKHRIFPSVGHGRCVLPSFARELTPARNQSLFVESHGKQADRPWPAAQFLPARWHEAGKP